ncbi:Uma2 family endonuclease [Micromonospora sp. CPCC 205371]|nr:Uma2 family endonuclease [Micromonospora sp. CPCC 205371]
MIPTNHGPWAEEEYLALNETDDRVELVDGSLYVSPSPDVRHQFIASRLAGLLHQTAQTKALYVFGASGLRLRPGRIVIPDIVITSSFDFAVVVAPVEATRLVCEITSPSNEAHDNVLKMHYYAKAGIPWYLLVEHKTATLRLFRLVGTTYFPHAVAEPGQALRISEPVTVQIRPEDLLP